MDSVAISRRTKDSFATIHLCESDHTVGNIENWLLSNCQYEERGKLIRISLSKHARLLKWQNNGNEKLNYLNVQPVLKKISPSVSASFTGHQIWPFRDLVSKGWWGDLLWKYDCNYITLPFPFSQVNFSGMFCFQRSCACEDGARVWTLARVTDDTWPIYQPPSWK